MIATDVAGTVTYWGSGAEGLYGWSEAEAMGRDILDLTPAELSRSEADGIMRTLQRGEPWSGNFIVQGKDGSRFAVEVTDTPVRDASGNLIGIIGTSRRLGYIEPR